MPSIIKILPDHVIDKIAAGEVVERPASVVKELIENAIDAGATEIFIDIEKAGTRLIRVTDNGSGMSKEDARTAFLRHATSKISDDADLEAIRTMGFRGEALSSIASVSHVRMLTSTPDSSSGVMVEIEAGKVKSLADAAAPQGASFEISHLFYNTPARLKFLKSVATEFSHILTAVARQAMAHPSIGFRLTHNKKPVLDLPLSMSVKERAFQLYGNEITENVMSFSGGRDNVHIHGLIGRPAYSRADRTYQDFYVNRRAVKNPSLTHAFYSAYGDMLMRGRHPVGFIFIDIDPALVDVNVHPAKAEVRFRNQSQIHDLLRDVIREGLRAHGMPVIATSEATGVYEAGVKESLADYLKGQSPGSVPAFGQNAPSFFGRRKRDLAATALQPGRDASLKEVDAGLHPQASLIPEHDLVPLAQVHNSFIVAQSKEGMAIIDQHAAHERVLFEKLQDQFIGGAVPIQNLLVPDQVELGPAQSGLLFEYLPELNKLGFAVEHFGGGTFVIKAVPALLVGADYKQLVLDVLDEVNVHGSSKKMEALRDEILSVMACHPAIKIHRRLDHQEMDALLHNLFKCRMPHTCPHGRPTIIRFSIDEIRKMFKRI
ncbi:MAG: DNA mismatch repair endonuclease MutL [Nitrospiraceae bacterium]|nr:DNA mismatch repair endonuclease MutL [Nitrospiraceae bacterium]